MSKHEDITELSDPRDITLDNPESVTPEIRIEKGNPSDEDIAALVTVLAAASGGNAGPVRRSSTCGGAIRSTSCATRSTAGTR